MLNSENDPLGHAVTDYYTLGKASKLFVDSDICERDEIPVPYLYRTLDNMPLIEKRAIDLCRGHVLDIGAAAGAHSLALINRGIQTSAIDISSLSVEIMKKRGINNAKCADFYNLSGIQKYDTLLFLMNGAGIAGTLEGLSTLLEKCKQLLKPNGQILLDSSDIIYMYDSPDKMPAYYYGEVQYQLIYKDIYSNPFNWLFVDFNNMVKTAVAQGFQCTKVVDGPYYDYLAVLNF